MVMKQQSNYIEKRQPARDGAAQQQPYVSEQATEEATSV